ncbi:hypothetical protein [Methyloglobulus sp.]|uniref:hypothetical protein n=1 Tax=Methyloglobulus sp. TaxID=2518622 RepID=UPI00182613A3|nr:hypothetical protein [Methyloglobulus sp.]
MRVTLIFLLCFIIYGCQTAAEKQLSSMQNDTKTALSEINACVHKIEINPSYESIAKRYPINWANDPTILQLSDNTVPSDKDIQKIILAFNDMGQCRQLGIKLNKNIMPEIIPISLEAITAEDILTADLVQKKITWGDYNRKRTSLRNDFSAKARVVAAQVGNALAQSHQAEIQHQQEAIKAFSDGFNKGFDNNRTVITNCTGSGITNSVTCISH